jgi:parallel beta-helix repeat protein
VEGQTQNRQYIYSEPEVSVGSEEAADSRITIEGNKFVQNNKGVSISSGNGVKITQNIFSENTVLPIDLSDDSTVTPNDGVIDISLVNKGMDYPVITYAELDPRGWSLYVEGYIGTDPTSPTEQANFSNCTVEVYISTGDFSGYGEGSTYLGSGQTTSTNSFAFTLDVRNKGVTRGTTITAIALHPDPTTSESSQNTTVAGGPVISNVWAKHIYYEREATSPPPPQTTITWNTDIPATSQVVYDTISHASPTDTYAYASPVNLTPTTSHVVTLTDVATNTLYFYRVKSTSTEGYLSISPEFKLPPGGAAADTDLCASCHRSHTAPHLAIPPQKNATPLILPLISNP